jgi:hypothetical protein
VEKTTPGMIAMAATLVSSVKYSCAN